MLSQKYQPRGFPSGSVVKNQPARAGGMGSIPDSGKSHMSWSNEAHASQLLSTCSTAQEPQLLSSPNTATEAHASQQEGPLQREACTPQLESTPQHTHILATARENPVCHNRDPAQSKEEEIKLLFFKSQQINGPSGSGIF